MSKFSKKLQSDEYDLLNYKLELLERRLESMEKRLDARSESGINSELMQLMMTLLKQQVLNPTYVAQPIPHTQVQVPQSHVAPTTEEATSCDPSVAAFMRRRTFV